MSNKTHITIGKGDSKRIFSISYLKSVTEEVAISDMKDTPRSSVVSVWKQAHGLSKPNRRKSED